MIKIIGLSGKMGCGKSTIADNLQELLTDLGYGVARLSFATLLKQECAEFFSFPQEFCYTPEGKARKIPCSRSGDEILPAFVTVEGDNVDMLTVRELMQWFGMRKRKVNPNYWIRAMEKAVEAVASRVDYVIIDDVRFPDEAAFVKDRNGITVRIHPYAGWACDNADHESETALDNYTGFSWAISPAFGKLHMAACMILDVVGEWFDDSRLIELFMKSENE